MTQGHTPEIVIGFMSGTSLDGVDAALLETDGVAYVRRGPALHVPYSNDEKAILRRAVDAAVADRAACTGPEAENAAGVLARTHAIAGKQLMQEAGPNWQPTLAGFHGQTILHRPDDRFTCQIGDAQALSAALGVPVVFDMRQADVAAGGQGAPLAPLYHAALAAGALAKGVAERAAEGAIGVLNLGGVANITLLTNANAIDDEDWAAISAFDTGPANGLLDDWVARHGAGHFDEGGQIAAKGQVDESRLASLMAHGYFGRPAPKSLDRHDFTLAAVEGLGLEDGAATLTAFTAASVAAGFGVLKVRPARVVATGGGRLNITMMRMLEQRLGCPVVAAEEMGWCGDAMEAEAFAYLAKRAVRGLPLSVPGTTGAPGPISGGVVTGA